MRTSLFLALILSFLLISCKEQPTKTEVVTLVETETSWDGNKLPHYPEGDPQIKILKYTIPPNTQLPVHKHLVINAGVLLKGELTVIDEYKNTLHLKAGDPIVELVNTFHYGKNEGSQPAEIIVFYAATKGNPVTVIKK
ncbi:cupin domain-containing protein [Spongiimicrobium sp. 3-5]|uniref:cupin domain-containing protein n=1 Tax=Spongiimicrobium sp. 3-5 TaxID=3332596 RepID=UPI003980054A